MRMRPATAPRGQAFVLRRWIVIASRARVNMRVIDRALNGCGEHLVAFVHRMPADSRSSC